MTTGDWIGIGGLAVTLLGGVIAWARRVEAHMSKVLTREEHERICQARNERVEHQLDELRDDMERRHVENREMLESIQSISTGTHRRLDEFMLKLMDRQR